MTYMVRMSNSGRYYTTFDLVPDPQEILGKLDEDISNKFLSGKPYIGLSAINADIDLPTLAFPKTARETQGRKQLYDFLNMAPRRAVSGEFKNIVEYFEPNVHQFSDEIEVFYKDGRRAEKKYYGLQMRAYLDKTVVLKKSFKVTPHERIDGGTYYSGSGLADSYYFDERAIHGRHFWAAHDSISNRFMSDEMLKAVKKAKIMGLEFKHQLSGPS
jgi:hypothetical protein